MKQIDDRNWLADEGKVFRQTSTGEIYGYGICLGDEDSIDNYQEIDNPDPNNPEYNPNYGIDNPDNMGGPTYNSVHLYATNPTQSQNCVMSAMTEA